MSSKIKLFSLVFLFSLGSCKNRAASNDPLFEGYSQTETGLFYKFHSRGSGTTVQKGDVAFVKMFSYWCDDPIVDMTLDFDPYTVLGPIEGSLFPGDLFEGLMMMTVGDSASFIFPADSVIKHLGLRKSYIHHLCQFMRVSIRVNWFEPFAGSDDYFEQLRVDAERQARVEESDQVLRNHLRKNNITVSPNNDGVYVIVTQRGTGARITASSTVIFDYTARLVCGRILDSSCEDISFYAGIISPWRDYQPQEITVGEQRWITGLDNALIGQTVGSTLRLIMPSAASTGQRQFIIPNFQPLILDVEILDVR